MQAFRAVARASGGKIAELSRLTLPDDAEAISLLVPPAKSALRRASAADLEKVATRFGELWLALASGNSGDGERFWEVLLSVGEYFGFGLYRFAAEANAEAALKLLRTVDLDSRGEEDPSGSSAAADIQRAQAESLLAGFTACASDLLFATSVDEMELQPGAVSPTYDADVTAMRALERLHTECQSLDGEPLELADALLAQSMEFRREMAQERSERRGAALKKPAGLVNVKELVLLSRRHHLMEDKHGAKGVEHAFEERLGAIFETFGFIVVPAPPGRAVVDLVCVSHDPRYTFLVEAKTSRSVYALPKDDQRAIADYARAFPASLPTLKPLEFVLIVGPEPARTVPAKLEELQRAAEVPVRFASASLIGTLQQELAGPVDPRVFLEAMTRPGTVLADEVVDLVKAGSRKLSIGITEFVEFLRSSRAPG